MNVNDGLSNASRMTIQSCRLMQINASDGYLVVNEAEKVVITHFRWFLYHGLPTIT